MCAQNALADFLHFFSDRLQVAPSDWPVVKAETAAEKRRPRDREPTLPAILASFSAAIK